MLQAKRLLAVVVGSHDTQQHELSVKEGEKVIVVVMVRVIVVVVMVVWCWRWCTLIVVVRVREMVMIMESHDTQQHQLCVKE